MVTIDKAKDGKETATVNILKKWSGDKDALQLLKNVPNLQVVYIDNGQVNDAAVAPLKDLTGLSALTLMSPQVTDAGLENLKGLTNLTMLFLTGSKVGDKGLPSLKGLKNLQVLALSRTQVTDAGLDALKDLKSLKSVYLIGTKVTPRPSTSSSKRFRAWRSTSRRFVPWRRRQDRARRQSPRESDSQRSPCASPVLSRALLRIDTSSYFPHDLRFSDGMILACQCLLFMEEDLVRNTTRSCAHRVLGRVGGPGFISRAGKFWPVILPRGVRRPRGARDPEFGRVELPDDRRAALAREASVALVADRRAGALRGGVTETVARLPSALGAVGLVLGIAVLASRHYGPEIGLLAGAIQATTAWTVMRGRLAEADVLLACVMTWTIVAFDRVVDSSPAQDINGRDKRLMQWRCAVGALRALGCHVTSEGNRFRRCADSRRCGWGVDLAVRPRWSSQTVLPGGLDPGSGACLGLAALDGRDARHGRSGALDDACGRPPGREGRTGPVCRRAPVGVHAGTAGPGDAVDPACLGWRLALAAPGFAAWRRRHFRRAKCGRVSAGGNRR